MSDSPVGAVDKALLALTALADAGPDGVTLAQMSAGLGLHKPTLHRTLSALRHRGFAEQPTEGRYVLGPAALALGDGFLRTAHLPALLRPVLARLCDELGELVHLGSLVGREIVYLDKVEPARAVRVWSEVGAHRPAATTALGRALLCRLDLAPAALDWYARPDTTAAHLAEVLAQARARGWAAEVEENEPGIACVAVPLLRAGTPVAALSVTVPTDRADDARRQSIAHLVLDALPRLLPPGLSLSQE